MRKAILHGFQHIQGFCAFQLLGVSEAIIYYIGGMTDEDLGQFLICIGSSVYMAKDIKVIFNVLTGTAQGPITHTCEPSLILNNL